MLSQKELLSPTIELFLQGTKEYRFERPADVTMPRRYRGRVAAGRRRRPPRKGQRGKGFFDTLKIIAKNPLVKNTLEKTALTYAPKLYNYETRKIKNKTARKILQSAAAIDILNIELQVTVKIVRGNGISNIDIETFFENKTNDDLKKNFMGVYSSNSITK